MIRMAEGRRHPAEAIFARYPGSEEQLANHHLSEYYIGGVRLEDVCSMHD